MSLAKAEAKINNIVNRVVSYGKKDKLHLVDRNTKEVLVEVRLWSWQSLNPLEQGDPEYSFRLAATPESSEYLPTCLIVFNGRLHDVIVRTPPDSVAGIEWTLKTKPTNELVEV
jgi:hypothetical protein